MSSYTPAFRGNRGLRLRRSPGFGDSLRSREAHSGLNARTIKFRCCASPGAAFPSRSRIVQHPARETVTCAKFHNRLTVARRRRIFTVFPCAESSVIVYAAGRIAPARAACADAPFQPPAPQDSTKSVANPRPASLPIAEPLSPFGVRRLAAAFPSRSSLRRSFQVQSLPPGNRNAARLLRDLQPSLRPSPARPEAAPSAALC